MSRGRLVLTLLNPFRLFVAIWRALGVGPFWLRLKFDAVERPPYAYGIYWAAMQAKRLGLPRISVIEFGVAGGTGLVVMEQHAAAVERETGVGIEVYGFDRAVGLPEPSDYRDMPYFFRGGTFTMDEAALRARLTRAELVLGDVKNTVGGFANAAPAPIGFVAFDLDLYSSTRDAFALFSLPDDFLLPRVICYFDDIIGPDLFFGSADAGELLAIREFNAQHQSEKIEPIYGLETKRLVACPWAPQIFAFHRFTHRLYTAFISVGDHTFALQPAHSRRLRAFGT
jgi:hypothetical protein